MVSGTATWLCFLMLAMALGAPPEGAVDPSSGGTDAPPKPALPSSYWGWKGASGQKPSYSVVIPAHNTAGRILDTLRSVQASIEYFHKNGGKEFQGEVVVVDDASTDNTASKVMAYIDLQRRHNITNPRWKLVAMQHNVLGGSARNFGVRESSGDVLLYCDSDDLFLERHIAVAFTSLLRRPEVAMIQTLAKIELDDIHPRWKEKVEGTIPLTRCLWRKVHDFIEGYPEQGVFTRHQDVGYLLAYAASGAPMAIAAEETVVYKRYPGNSLDQQAQKFLSDPKFAPRSAEEQTEEHPVRMGLINLHADHVKRKVAALIKGESPVKTNPLWAIYQHAADMAGPDFVDLVDVKKTRFRRLVDAAEHYTFSGNQEDARKVFNIVHKFVYNATAEEEKPPEPLYFAISS